MTFTITGTNDAPVSERHDRPGGGCRARRCRGAGLSALSGSFAVIDRDVGDTLDPAVVAGSPVVQLNGTFALPAGAAALTAAGAFALTGATSNGGAASIGYSYDPGAANLDFLRLGQSLTITYTVQGERRHGDSGTQDVTFTITGTNDAPVLSDTTDPGAVAEARQCFGAGLSAISRQLRGERLDVGDTLTPAVCAGSPVVQLNGNPFALPAGAAALTAAGAFALTGRPRTAVPEHRLQLRSGRRESRLPAHGQSLTITYTVKVSDGTATSAPRT